MTIITEEPMVPLAQEAAGVGVTTRQLHHWIARGVITVRDPHPGSGAALCGTLDDVWRLAACGALASVGIATTDPLRALWDLLTPFPAEPAVAWVWPEDGTWLASWSAPDVPAALAVAVERDVRRQDVPEESGELGDVVAGLLPALSPRFTTEHVVALLADEGKSPGYQAISAALRLLRSRGAIARVPGDKSTAHMVVWEVR